MLHIHPIDSLEGPDLEPYRTMKRPLDHARKGIFVAEGEKVVRRLLESAFTVESLLLPQRWLDEYRALLERRTEDIRVFVAEKELLERLTGFTFYQGVLAVGRIPSSHSLPALLATTARPCLLVAVDGITNATNLGVMVRNARAMGVHAMIVGEKSCSPFLRRAVRNSMGAILQLPIVDSTNLVETIQELKKVGIRCVAAHPRPGSKKIYEADFRSDCCIVLGSEGDGISESVLSVCDDCVEIPMAQQVDSLNVSNAAAIFFYEALRQRGRV